MDTCKFLTVGPLSLPLSLSHTHKRMYISPLSRQSHVCVFQSECMEWKSVVFHFHYSLWVISTCVQARTHTIPPADWRPPGHNQSGPGVKIIVSLVWRRTTHGGINKAGRRIELDLTNVPYNHTWKYTHLFGETTSGNRQALNHVGCGYCVMPASVEVL